jgi:alkylhydroperoxidase family enzyme
MAASEIEPRIALAPTALEAMGPPIKLFKLFSRNLVMAEAMTGWGSYELSKRLSVPMRIRELVIDRVTARCGAEYEWGVHVRYFADRVGLTDDQLRSLTHGSAEDPCWTPEEGAVLQMVDQLHDTNDVDDSTWSALMSHYTDVQALDLLLLAGWYHAISFVANAARVPHEGGTPRFSDYSVPVHGAFTRLSSPRHTA